MSGFLFSLKHEANHGKKNKGTVSGTNVSMYDKFVERLCWSSVKQNLEKFTNEKNAKVSQKFNCNEITNVCPQHSYFCYSTQMIMVCLKQ